MAGQKILTRDETANLAHISVRTLDRMCEIGEGPPAIRLSMRRRGFFRADVLNWLAARRTGAVEAPSATSVQRTDSIQQRKRDLSTNRGSKRVGTRHGR